MWDLSEAYVKLHYFGRNRFVGSIIDFNSREQLNHINFLPIFFSPYLGGSSFFSCIFYSLFSLTLTIAFGFCPHFPYSFFAGWGVKFCAGGTIGLTLALE